MESDGFEPLLDRYQGGESSPEEVAALVRMLRQDPDRRRRFVERWLLEVQLRKVFSGLVPVRPAAKRPARRFSWVGVGAAAAVLLALGAFLLGRFGGKQAPAAEVASGQVRIDGAEVERIPAGVWFDIVGGSSAVLRLPDGSRAELEPTSRASLQERPAEGRSAVALAEGGGVFQVAHGGGRFRVETDAGTVTALGTEFAVRLRRRGADRAGGKGRLTLSVTVREGSVEVDAGGKSRVLSAGKSRVFGDDGDQNDHDDGEQNK
jgi:ferric-dicitrate binding protein FerR (iron transport regulator)